jgi:hypothetical protein
MAFRMPVPMPFTARAMSIFFVSNLHIGLFYQVEEGVERE